MFEQYLTQGAGMVNGGVLLFTYALIAVLFGLVGFILYWITSFKINVVIRHVTKDGQQVVSFDKGKIIEKKGMSYFRLLKSKAKLPTPPAESINITVKGKKHVEVFRIDSGDFVYANPMILTKDGTITKEVVSGLEPLTTNQRQLFYDELKRAEKYKKLTWQELIPIITNGLVLVIIVGIVFMFWDRVTQPSLDFAAELRESAKQVTKGIEILATSCSGHQYIPTASVEEVAATLPPQ